MFERLLEKIAISLERSSIAYMVIGGQAVLVYAEPRLTKDIDITLGVGSDRAGDVVRLAEASGWKVLVESPQKFAKETMVLPCLDPSSGIRIDFIFSVSEYEQQALQRVKRFPMGSANICFASPEDLVIHKVIAGRPRDLEDVRLVLVKNPEIDTRYIEKWLSQFQQSLSQDFLGSFKRVRDSIQ
jgi:hypothetical protein